MGENDEGKVVDTEELKKETIDTVNQVKDTIKNVDIKNDAKEATGFVSAMFKDPFEKIKEIATDNKNKNLKVAIIFLAIWMIAEFIYTISSFSYGYWSGSRLFSNIWRVISATAAPVIGILVISAIVLIMNKKAKKSLPTIMTSFAIANIPMAIASVFYLFNLLSSGASSITGKVSGFCGVLTTILTYFTMKALFEEEQNSKFIKTFVVVEAIYYAIAFLLTSVLGMYI